MKLKAPEFIVDENNPFENDLIERKQSVEAFYELLKSLNESLVVCINSPWGYGKTSFVKMMQAYLANKNMHSLYFNCWENDFVDDAFASLIGDLGIGIDALELEDDDKKELRKTWEQAKKIGAKLLKKSIPAVVKLSTAGIIDTSDLTEKTLSELSQQAAEDTIKYYEESKKSVSYFKSKLSEVAQKIADPDHGGHSLVIFIDELDRCKPTHAVRVLEAVKHFFSVPNITFVLALDKRQIGNSLRVLYGSEMDVDGYLRRFIDIELNLPEPNYEQFCIAQFKKFGLDVFFEKRTSYYQLCEDKQKIQKLFVMFFSAMGISLREQEKAFSTLSLVIRSTPQDNFLFPRLLVTLIILKLKNYELYRDFSNYKKTEDDVLNYLRSFTEIDEYFLNSEAYLEAELNLSRCTNYVYKDTCVKKYKKKYEQTTSPEMKQYYEQIVYFLNSDVFENVYGTLGNITKKINLF